MENPGKALVIGISGVSSSGKTTLARLLRDIFPRTFILHEDDFYKPDSEIPVNGGFQDWDCIDALDLPQMREALVYIREKGMLPPTLVSKEDQNSVGDSGVNSLEISKLREQAHVLCFRQLNMPIAIIDGFLLYSEGMKQIRELLDVKLFLRTHYKTAKTRREARSGYVTLEGFWEDPPGYVDKIVWPNYVKDHSFLFKNANVEGDYDEEACTALQLNTMPERAQESMTACLHWAFDVVRSRIEQTSSERKEMLVTHQPAP